MIKKKKTSPLVPKTHDDVPTSVGLVKEVRDELRAEIQVARHELKAEIQTVKAEIQTVKAEVQNVLVVVNQTLVSAHQTQVLMEEQRSENRIVLDGLKTVIDRQNRLEIDVAEIRAIATTRL